MSNQRDALTLLILLLLLTGIACEFRTLGGTVIDDAGRAISDCAVTLEVGTNGALHLYRRTDAAGKFSFGETATAGGCAIQFQKSGYEDQILKCPMRGNTPLLVTLRAQRNYVLPVADGSVEPSPASFQGRITQVSGQEIEVAPSHEDTGQAGTVAVRLTPQTSLFTVYGGRVSSSELLRGQLVRVWLDRPGAPQADHVMNAAVIMLASKDPKDAWP